MTLRRLQFTRSTSPVSRVVGESAWRTPTESISGNMMEALIGASPEPSTVRCPERVIDGGAEAEADRGIGRRRKVDAGHEPDAYIIGPQVGRTQETAGRLPLQVEIIDLQARGDVEAS